MREQCVGERGERFRRGGGIAERRGVGGEPGENAHDIAIDAGGGSGERNARNRGGGVGGDAGEVAPFGGRAR